MARYVPGIPASGVGPESDLGHSKESELQVCAYGFHEAASVTDAWKQRRCPALVQGEGGGLHCPEPNGTGYLLSAPPRKGSSPWLSATWLCPCAFYKGLRRRPCRLRVGGGRGRVLATVGCSPRRTRSVTCALCFAVARAPAFVSGSAQGGTADMPSGPRFLFHGGDAACTPCKAPVCDAWTCRARSDSRCRPLCATRLPCPLGRCPAQQTSRDCAHPPPSSPPQRPGPKPSAGQTQAGGRILGPSPSHHTGPSSQKTHPHHALC